MAPFNPLASARERAFLLANNGEHPSWPLIAKALAHEGFGAVAIKQIGKDANAQREIAARILVVEQARLADQAAPAQTWRVEDPRTRVVLKDD
ncbi:hypothetical protein U91I_03513 [alpha proteobacterium U9-1i]|nr:hypothetical protein U91I_03513 [alpha proteobacterium U9-1i]